MQRLTSTILAVCCLTFFSFGQQDSATPPQSTSAQKEPSVDPAKPTLQKDKAIVYFYRYKQYAGSMLAPSVYCDEAQLARMDNGSYFTVTIDPGKHTFRSNDKQSGAEINLKAGQEYFLRVEIVAGFMKGHGRLVAVVPEQARYELKAKGLKPLDTEMVADKVRVSTEPIQFTETQESKQ